MCDAVLVLVGIAAGLILAGLIQHVEGYQARMFGVTQTRGTTGGEVGMKIEFCGAIVEITDEGAGHLDFMRVAQAAFMAAGYSKHALAETVEEWLEDYRLEQAEPGLEV